jgi:hypothetical protein
MEKIATSSNNQNEQKFEICGHEKLLVLYLAIRVVITVYLLNPSVNFTYHQV